MQLTFLKGYPDYIGKRFAFVGYGTGPKSYVNTGTSSTSGDPIVLPRFDNYVDVLFADMSISGNYYVHVYAPGVGARQAWVLRWFVTSTNAEVANGVNLSAESLQVGGLGGVY